MYYTKFKFQIKIDVTWILISSVPLLIYPPDVQNEIRSGRTIRDMWMVYSQTLVKAKTYTRNS